MQKIQKRRESTSSRFERGKFQNILQIHQQIRSTVGKCKSRNSDMNKSRKINKTLKKVEQIRKSGEAKCGQMVRKIRNI